MSIFWLVSVAIAWFCGSNRIPQRWFPRNPVVDVIEAMKRKSEADLVAKMILRSQDDPAASAPAQTQVQK